MTKSTPNSTEKTLHLGAFTTSSLIVTPYSTSKVSNLTLTTLIFAPIKPKISTITHH